MILSVSSSPALVSGLMVVRAKNPVHSVSFPIPVFRDTSGLLLLLGLDFSAMIFPVVHIGAIAVSFLFVVMMFHMKNAIDFTRRNLRKINLPLLLEIEMKVYFFFIRKKPLIWLLRFIIALLISIFIFYRILYPFLWYLERILVFSGACAVFPTTSSDLGLPVFEGIPVYESIWGTPAQALYFPTLLHLPPDSISDAATLSKLAKLNGYILFFEDLHHEMNPAYSLAIQQELDRTAAVSLPAKLESFIRVEEARFQEHALFEILWRTYSKEPYFLPVNRSIFEESVRLTLQRYGFATDNFNQKLAELIWSLRLEGRNSRVFCEVLRDFMSNP